MSEASKANSASLKAWLQNEAHALGFDGLGVAAARLDPQIGENLSQAISNEYHGTMEWLAETLERRKSPQNMWAEAKMAFVLVMNYGSDADPLATLEKAEKANISVYARNRDYHDIVKGKLKILAGKLAARAGGNVKVFVDTAPLMEKPLAQLAGLGWQGKHTNLVSRQWGSWLFIGIILSDLDLETDETETDHCGSCCACLEACPTNAFPAPYKLDGRRCISYLTIEHKGMIDREFREAMGNRIYGCDDCLAACPWNKYAQTAKEIKLHARADLMEPEIEELLKLDDSGFRQFFSGSPIKRIGRTRFIRNVLIAAGNSNSTKLSSVIKLHLSDEDPTIRAMAVWALSCLCGTQEFSELKTEALKLENDETVIAEWNSSHEQ